MNTLNDKCPDGSSSSCQLLSPHTAPLVLFFESTPSPEELASPFKGSMHGGGLPEFTFGASHNDDVLFLDAEGDPLDILSPPAVDDGGEIGFDDDLFSAYIDVKKFEERETEDDDNTAALPEDNLQINGGGFVVESGGGGGGNVGRGRRKRKDKSKDVIRATPTTKKRQRRGSQSCLAADTGFVEPRKAMAAEELAELWNVDPKRAKRIVANRHSAARSKERKAHYIFELEEKVKKLNSEVAFLSSRLAANQKETTDLAAEKSELKCQLQSLECEAEQIDAQIEALNLDIEWLRSATWKMDIDSFDIQESQSPCFQCPPSPIHKPFSMLQNCQHRTLSPYIQEVNSQPLF